MCVARVALPALPEPRPERKRTRARLFFIRRSGVGRRRARRGRVRRRAGAIHREIRGVVVHVHQLRHARGSRLVRGPLGPLGRSRLRGRAVRLDPLPRDALAALLIRLARRRMRDRGIGEIRSEIRLLTRTIVGGDVVRDFVRIIIHRGVVREDAGGRNDPNAFASSLARSCSADASSAAARAGPPRAAASASRASRSRFSIQRLRPRARRPEARFFRVPIGGRSARAATRRAGKRPRRRTCFCTSCSRGSPGEFVGTAAASRRRRRRADGTVETMGRGCGSGTSRWSTRSCPPVRAVRAVAVVVVDARKGSDTAPPSHTNVRPGSEPRAGSTPIGTLGEPRPPRDRRPRGDRADETRRRERREGEIARARHRWSAIRETGHARPRVGDPRVARRDRAQPRRANRRFAAGV